MKKLLMKEELQAIRDRRQGSDGLALLGHIDALEAANQKAAATMDAVLARLALRAAIRKAESTGYDAMVEDGL